MTIVGSSSEKILGVENGIIETCPIAGTRRRGRNVGEGDVMTKELLAYEKENAEHVMLVDPWRNDIDAVCVPLERES